MKKILSSLFIFTLIVSLIAPSIFAKNIEEYFPEDIDEHWAFYELDDFVNADILNGYIDADGIVTLKPDQSITRAEFVTILVRALHLESDPNVAGVNFDDVLEGQWYYEPIQIASSLKIVNGYNEYRFEPNRNITRQEIAKIIAKAFESSIPFDGEAVNFTDVTENWAKPFIDQVSMVGIVNGYKDNTFKPLNNATRAEAVKMLYNALHLETSDLTSEETLINFVLNYDDVTIAMLNNQQWEDLAGYNQENLTGYAKENTKESVGELENYTNEGLSIKATLISTDRTGTVLENSNRFAVVSLENSIYEFEFQSNDGSYYTKAQEDTSSFVYLKKDSDNQWKIYFIEQ